MRLLNAALLVLLFSFGYFYMFCDDLGLANDDGSNQNLVVLAIVGNYRKFADPLSLCFTVPGTFCNVNCPSCEINAL